MKFIPPKTYNPKPANNRNGSNLILTRIKNLAADIATLDASDAFETPHAAVAVAISGGWMNTYALFSPSFSTCVLSCVSAAARLDPLSTFKSPAIRHCFQNL
jgi:hypothetical protein